MNYSVVRSCCSKLAIVTKIGGGKETGNFVPNGDFLFRDVPKSELTFQRTIQEVPIILEMPKQITGLHFTKHIFYITM